ncbi:cation diffusion facilitator family transporter [Marivirga atlantica]|uniref:Cation transporter n=1 Tax=Marivirga atlantica TaxID=1548457 RepID=A0A937DIT5_9BACT|nr:cation diffusion facilitator family transporter [Marivirga atlantica]MBL0764149.1 cation transporter [Marivirga atlantica]
MVKEKRLFWVILINIVITVLQIIGGIYAHSLALISDATHNFSDVAALTISLIAILLAKKKPTYSKSFGYKRAEILAAFINSAAIIVVAIFIMYESIERLITGNIISENFNLIIYLALFAVIGNGLSAFFLYSKADRSMNMRSAFLHLLSDMLFSVAVLISGLLMKYYSFYWTDPLLSVGIGIYLIVNSIKLLKSSTRILLQFVPAEIDIPKLVDEVSKLPEVKNIHHLHIWQLDDEVVHLEAHVDLENNLHVSETAVINKKIENLLHTRFAIGHTTLQFEYGLEESKAIIQ